MKTVVWVRHEGASDWQSETLAYQLLKRNHIVTGNSLVLAFVSKMVLQGVIEDVWVDYADELYKINPMTGIIENLPIECDGTAQELYSEILDLRLKKTQ